MREPGLRRLARLAFALTAALAGSGAAAAPLPIDRHALVNRHQPVLRAFDTGSPLSVGNGELAFTADVTGLQTFAEAYDETIPLGTLSQWGWHTAPNPQGFAIDRFRFTDFDAHGRAVGYADIPGDRRTPEIEWLRANPHRLHLGRIGFRLTLRDGRAATRDDLTDVEQTLDLWNGVLRSRFRIEGEPVAVETLCHPALDLVAVRVVSPLVRLGRIAVRLRFPYGTGAATAADWTRPEAHETTLVRQTPTSAALDRRLDGDRYHVRLAWAPEAALVQEEKHAFVLAPGHGHESLEAVIGFTPTPATETLPGFDETRRAAREHWNRFWSTGGAIDLSGSRDPRWRELERRIVLSQYLTAIQCSGRFPPQETGLTFNSWEGKFHLEMHWWHAAHFALWGRLPLLERSLGYYSAILPRARETAARQGYCGRPLAEDDQPERRGVAVEHRALPRVAAAAPDLLRGARPPGARRPRDPRAVPRRRLRDGGVHGVLRVVGRGGPAIRPGAAPPGGAGDLPEGPHRQHHASSSPTGAGASRRRSDGARRSPSRASPAGSACSIASRPCPCATVATCSPRPRRRASTTPDGRAITRRSSGPWGCCPAAVSMRRPCGGPSTGSGRTGAGPTRGAGTTRSSR